VVTEDNPMSNTAVTPDAIAVASEHQLSTTLSGEVVILGLRDAIYYGLQEVGARIWDLLQTPHSVREIVQHIVDEYDVPEEIASADVCRLIGELQQHGLVTVEALR
jgi:Coenzyme PQQ synthesis protein D (PqqD)